MKKYQNGDTFPSGHPGAPNNPIRLKPLIVRGKQSPLGKIKQFFNDEILLNKGNVRVRNYQKAEANNPNFSRDWDMAANIAEGANVMSGGLLNRLSPTQNIGLIIDAIQGDNIMQSWFGNSGIVSDNFAQNHPWLSFGINALGDVGIGLGINNPNVRARLRHPTYKKYYHGTANVFDIQDAQMGTPLNSGLHASGTPTIAKSVMHSRSGAYPRVEEFWAPRPSTETIDTWDNGITQLSSRYTIEPRTGMSSYYAAGKNSLLFKLIRKQGGNPVMVKGKPAFQIAEPVTLNLRKSIYPKIPKSAHSEIDDLLKEYSSKRYSDSFWRRIPKEYEQRLSEINKRAAEIMSEAGYKVVKYNNTNPYEGGGGTSYFITDPSKIYQPGTYRIPWSIGIMGNND